MLRNVYLHGHLGKEFGKVHRISVNSFDEAIRAMNCRRPGFKQAIRKDADYALVTGSNLEKKRSLTKEEFELKPKFNNNEDFHIVPVAAGQKSNWLGIIVGVLLLVVTYFYPALAPYTVPMALGLILGGVSQMLAPAPNLNNMDYNQRERPEERPSYIFNGPTNTTEQGTIVPLVYGETFIGSKTISASLDVV